MDLWKQARSGERWRHHGDGVALMQLLGNREARSHCSVPLPASHQPRLRVTAIRWVLSPMSDGSDSTARAENKIVSLSSEFSHRSES